METKNHRYEISVYEYDRGCICGMIHHFFSNDRDEAIGLAETYNVDDTRCVVTDWETGDIIYDC